MSKLDWRRLLLSQPNSNFVIPAKLTIHIHNFDIINKVLVLFQRILIHLKKILAIKYKMQSFNDMD